MLTPLILFLGLTVATAVIAHWSDNLGKKLGKKRVSLFGLRPRTTATILTVASSWGIMLFTLAALLIAVAPLRNALFSYDRERAQAQRDREQAKIEIGSAQKRLTATQQQVETANAQVKTANSQLNQAQSNLKKADQEVKQAQKAAKAAEAEGKKRAAEAKKQADEAVARAKEAQSRVVEAQNRVIRAQKSLVLAQSRERLARNAESVAQGETRNAKGETERAQRETRLAQQLRRKASVDLELSLVRLETAQSQFKSTQNNLRAAQSNLRKTQENLQSASAAYDRASRAAIDTGAQVIQLDRRRIQLENLAQATLSNDAPIKRDQAFAARIIDASQSPQTIVAQLREMLTQAQEAFRKAEDDLPEPRFPSGAGVQLLPLPVPDASGNPLILEGEQLLQRLASDIIEQGQPTSARLVAPRNFLPGETQIELRFVFVPIEPAFRAGEVLASLTIDGSQGDALIFNSLLELTNLGRNRAEVLKVRPPESPTQPNFYASDTNVRLFEAWRILERSKARLRVNLVAAKDLTTVEPLKVRFVVEGATGSSMPTS